MASAKKLGELLVQEGVITSHQLEEALKYQVIFGGKLGTNLIELDFVQEDDIAKTLSKMLRVPLVSGDELIGISEEIIRLIPRDMAERYQTVPLHLEHRKLTLVMANPADLKAIDEIAFRTGYIIRPAVAPEVRLILALEQYYHIPREIRYVQVSKKIERILAEGGSEPRRTPAIKQESSSLPSAKADAAAKAAAEKVAAEKAAAEKAAAEKAAAEKAAAEKAAAEKAAAEKAAAEKAAAEKAAAEKAAAEKAAAEAAEEVMELMEADIVEEGTEDLDDLDALGVPRVFQTLAEAADREDIAESIARFVGRDVDRFAMFQIRGDTAHGWRMMIDNKPNTNFTAFSVTLDHPSILKTVTDTASYYIGPIPQSSADNLRLVEELGGTPPRTALLVPVIVMSRVVTVLYVDDKRANLSERLIDLQKLAAKMAMSFEILILKNKILLM